MQKLNLDGLEVNELLKVFETIVECSNDGFWVIDFKKNTEYQSPRFWEILGYNTNDIEKQNGWQSLIFAEDLVVALDNYDKHLKDATHPYYQKVRYRHKDGSTLWVICRGIAIRDKDGNPTKLVGIHTDITDLKIIENQLKIEKNNAKKANLAKTIFLASMSHEIRTPMNSIMGLLQVIDSNENDNAKKKILSRIMDSAQMLSSILDDILDYSKMDSEKISLHKKKTDIKKNLKMIIVKYKSLYPNLKFSYKFHNMNKSYLIDESRFIQVISNLISNAAKYTPSGKIYISVNTSPDNFIVKIKDTGIGMSKETIKHIFEPFYRDESGQFMATGTGLGLCICKKISYYMEGKIWCKSKIGRGSTFYFQLPIKNSNISDINKSIQNNIQNSTSIKIAIAEDNPNNIFVMEQLLNLVDQKITFIAKTGKEIVKEISKNDYDLIFMDDKMPIMTGIEATHKIKAIKPDIYIVALTANALYGDKEKYLKIMDDYISKPMLLEDLKKCFERFRKYKQQLPNLTPTHICT